VERRVPQSNAKNNRRSAQSLPEERDDSPRFDPPHMKGKEQMEPSGASASRDVLATQEKRMVELLALQKMRQKLLEQQMHEQQILLKRQLYEEQISRQKHLIEQERKLANRKNVRDKKASGAKSEALIKKDVKPRSTSRLPQNEKSKSSDISKTGDTNIFDRYTGAESTSGYSIFSDKYRVAGNSNARNESKSQKLDSFVESAANGIKHEENGQYLGASLEVTKNSVGTNQMSPLIDVEVADTCAQDFVETMFVTPKPPTDEDQLLITKGVNGMAVASERIVSEQNCGMFTAIDDDNTVVLTKQEANHEPEALAKESFLGDLVHSLWTCR
jgi:hypothetical protein